MSPAIRPTRHGISGPRRLLGIGLASALVVVALTASAQEADLKPLLDRLQRLERDIQTMNVQLSRGGSAPLPSSIGAPTPLSDDAGAGLPTVARLELRMTALENEARAATGRAEEVSHQIEQINQRLDKLVGDVDFRLGTLERAIAEMRGGQAPAGPGPRQNLSQREPGGAAEAAPVATAQASGPGPRFATPPGVLGTLPQEDADRAGRASPEPAPATPTAQAAAPAPAAQAGPLPEGPPRDQYSYAFGLLRQTRYDEAETALRAFLQAHPNDPLSGNARYWLGESFYVRADYVKAAEVFLENYQQDPKGSKAADTLLKLGMSLSNLDKKREACAAFDKLAKEYPDAPSNIQQVAGRERQKNGCR